MFPLSIKMNFRLLFVVSFISVAYAHHERKISASLNPGCDHCSQFTTLFYVKAEGAHDTIHKIWDFTSNIPTVIISITDINSTLSINWEDNKPTEFAYSIKPDYSFGFAIDKIVEYKEDGHTDPKCRNNTKSLSKFKWTRTIPPVWSEEKVELKMVGKKGRIVLNMKLIFLPYLDYAPELPHLIHTANSTLIDIALTNMTSVCGYNASRYGYHVVLADSDADKGKGMTLNVRRSLDDEHTPGVFEVIEIQTPKSEVSGKGGYVQFRPVGYTEPERGVTTSINAHVSDLTRTNLTYVENLMRYFSKTGPSLADILVEDVEVTFGDEGDSYQMHNYMAWSFAMGYGKPPVETFSLFVLMVIGCGIGIPVLLAASGIVYTAVRRVRQRRGRALLQDED